MSGDGPGNPTFFERWGLTARLLTMNAVVFAVFIGISLVVLFAWRHVESMLGETIARDLTRNIENTRLLADLTGIFDDASLLTNAFFRRDELLADRGAALMKLADSAAEKAEDQRLRAAIVAFRQSMGRVFDQCRTVNDILKRLDNIDSELGRGFTALEKTLAERKVQQVLLGEDPTYVEQLAVTVSGYRETLLQINVLLGKTGYEHFSVLKSRSAQPILALLGDLSLRAGTLAVAEPVISAHGPHLSGAIMRYQEEVARYFDAMAVLHQRHNALERAKKNAVELMQEIDARIAKSTVQVRQDIGVIMQSSRNIILLAAVVVISGLLVLTIYFILVNIRGPMRSVRRGLDAIRQGDLTTSINLGRRDEWRNIEEGVNEMAKELLASYRELAAQQQRLEKTVEERTRQLGDIHEELVKRERLAVLGKLTATVSHELRNPLGVIRHSIYYLQRRLDTEDEKIAKHLTRIEEQVALCDTIVDDLLEYTRGRLSERRMEDFNEWASKVIDSIQVPDGVRVEKALEPHLARNLFDTEKMRRVLVNLLTNALQSVLDRAASGEQDYVPRITFSTQSSGSGVRFTIADNGAGMDNETLSHAFEPLFTTKARGTGLGLAIVRKIVEEHDGSVTLESSPGAGTTATVDLPSGSGPSDEAPGPSRDVSPESGID